MFQPTAVLLAAVALLIPSALAGEYVLADLKS